MSKITFRLEVQDHYGSAEKTFEKDVESSFTPTKDMVFAGDDYTLEARTVFFLDDGNIIVRFVETPSAEEVDGWDFLLKEGWKKR